MTSAFGGQRSIHTRFARGWLLRTPTLSKLIEYIAILADYECLSIRAGVTCLGPLTAFYYVYWSCSGVNRLGSIISHEPLCILCFAALY